MSSKYHLYGRRGAGSLAIQIVLEETGAPYQISWVEKTPEAVARLRQVSPAGKVPVLVLPDGHVMAESAAILLYLSGAHPQAHLAPAAGTDAQARFLQGLVSLSANVYETALRYYYAERYSSAGAAAAAAIQERALEDYGRHLEATAADLNPFVAGAEYSAADPYLYMLAGWYPGDHAALERRAPALAAHAARVRARAATVRAEADHAE